MKIKIESFAILIIPQSQRRPSRVMRDLDCCELKSWLMK